MSKILYLDCSTGIACDMLLAALLDAGADLADIENGLAQLALGDWRMETARVDCCGIIANRLKITFPARPHHRTYDDIRALLTNVDWPQPALHIASAAFAALAEAEAAVHGCAPGAVHFHETGAVDSLLDICGCALALARLDIAKVYFSELPLTSGYVECAHGRLPLPAPAAALLLRGMRLFPSPLAGETVTPTGAALLKGCAAIQALPHIRLERIGHGAGSRNFAGQANVLRAMLGTDADTADMPAGITCDTVEVLRANIDDASGELLGQLWERAFAQGALDMSYTPVLMKKGRPAFALELVVKPGQAGAFAELVFGQTTTIGLRVHRETRYILPRENIKIATPFGTIGLKVSGDTVAPEADEVAAAAAAHQTSFKVVYQAVIAAYLSNH